MTNFAMEAKQLLEVQVEAASALTALLEKEYQQLKSHESGAIAETAQAKQVEVDKLEEYNFKWQALLNQFSVPIVLDDIKAYLQKSDQSNQGNLSKLFEQLGERAKGIQKQNMVNGTVLVLRQQATEHMLAILQGHASEYESTYGPSGKPESNGGGNTIAEA